MNTYTYEVKLVVEAEAFDPSDADQMIEDAFGLGENCGVNITEVEVSGHSS